jgi:hypothetical protein
MVNKYGAMRIIYPTESYEDALLLSDLTSLFLRRQQITNKVFLNIMNDDAQKITRTTAC